MIEEKDTKDNISFHKKACLRALLYRICRQTFDVETFPQTLKTNIAFKTDLNAAYREENVEKAIEKFLNILKTFKEMVDKPKKNPATVAFWPTSKTQAEIELYRLNRQLNFKLTQALPYTVDSDGNRYKNNAKHPKTRELTTNALLNILQRLTNAADPKLSAKIFREDHPHVGNDDLIATL